MRCGTVACGTVLKIGATGSRIGATDVKTSGTGARIAGIGGTRSFGAFEVGYAARTLRRFQMSASTT